MTSQSADAVSSSRRSKITPEREQEFYDAVCEQLREHGYGSLTMEGVAARSRCSKSTLYRQWKTKPQLVAAALRAYSRTGLEDIDTGSLADDLRAVVRFAGERSGRDTQLMQALGHAVLQDEELRRALREAVVDPEIGVIEDMVRRAVQRGEIPEDHPAAEFVSAQLLGVLRARPLLEGCDADTPYLMRFLEACVLPALGLARNT
ncbi:TetR/AcrR family transcriptional regulator [Streptomyces sp. PSKA54]|uniref:TetR/AcrR family transcriptional regulator n=1 Tax=Streptomyces himalayensis subsp. aureolus TaxID=2758039 RepID=A0A7W2D7P2_9ACTN|nr:TetR/AcrR family transcriptional regulator [Streptomyces himalayensis]MBA4866171.1 TetR/AcrR family transcriptional regulator [Streptomyces himalayensis subsp. aureolus]